MSQEFQDQLNAMSIEQLQLTLLILQDKIKTLVLPAHLQATWEKIPEEIKKLLPAKKPTWAERGKEKLKFKK